MNPVVVPDFLADGRSYIKPERVPSLPGWIACGHFAAFVGQEAAGLFSIAAKDRGDQLRGIISRDRLPPAERVFKGTKPHNPGQPDERPACGACGGSGECSCTCGDEHDCRKCEGEGKIGRQPKRLHPGARFYVDKGGDEVTALADALSVLLGGLRAFRNPGEYHERIVVGCDDQGDVVAIVAPMRFDAKGAQP